MNRVGYNETSSYKQVHSCVRQASIFTPESRFMVNFSNGVTAICTARLSGSSRCGLRSHSKLELRQLSSEDEKQPSVSILLEGRWGADTGPAQLLRFFGRSGSLGSLGGRKLQRRIRWYLHPGSRRMCNWPISAPTTRFPYCGLSKLLFRRILCLSAAWLGACVLG